MAPTLDIAGRMYGWAPSSPSSSLYPDLLPDPMPSPFPTVRNSASLGDIIPGTQSASCYEWGVASWNLPALPAAAYLSLFQLKSLHLDLPDLHLQHRTSALRRAPCQTERPRLSQLRSSLKKIKSQEERDLPLDLPSTQHWNNGGEVLRDEVFKWRSRLPSSVERMNRCISLVGFTAPHPGLPVRVLVPAPCFLCSFPSDPS